MLFFGWRYDYWFVKYHGGRLDIRMKKSDWTNIINTTHASVFGDVSKKSVFLALIGRGYFPRQLPPPFATASFANYVESNPDEFKKLLIDDLHKGGRLKTAELCRFSLARPGQLRRILGLPNPTFYYLLSLILADNFNMFEFENDFISPDYSMSFPKFEENEQIRAFEFLNDWDEIPIRRLKERAKGRYLVKTDIARFFPSIYTHSIPWALHGKKTAKKDRSAKLIGNFIDLLIRSSQDGQTLGIPIGPDSSFLISERILLEIDSEIFKQIKNRSIGCFHWVDDYEFVCLSRDDAEYCLSVLQQALQEYELELNTLKTQILELPENVQDPEVAQLRNFKFENEPNVRQLLEYYDLAFTCFNKHPKGTLKYAIKRIPDHDFYHESISDFMVQSMMLEPGVIEAVFVWLARANRINDVDKPTFTQCLAHIIIEHGRLGHASEVSWAIWGFILLEQEIPEKAVYVLCNMEDSVVLLLALDAKEKGLLKGKDLENQIEKLLDDNSLFGTHWLLSYEAAVHKWRSAASVNKEKLFKCLKDNGVCFYQSQDIEEYQKTMKNWEPYNPYVDIDVDVDEFDAIDPSEN